MRVLEDEITDVVHGFGFATSGMLHQFVRNGDVLEADGTHGINTFGFPVLSIDAKDQHHQTRPMFLALWKHKRQEDYGRSKLPLVGESG